MTPLEKALALRSAPLFSALDEAFVVSIARLTEVIDVNEGAAIVIEGEIGDCLYVIARGSAEVHRGDRTLATLGEGECVGEMAALDLEPRSATVTARGACRLLRLDRHDLLDLLIDHPKMVMSLAEVLAKRIENGSPP